MAPIEEPLLASSSNAADRNGISNLPGTSNDREQRADTTAFKVGWVGNGAFKAEAHSFYEAGNAVSLAKLRSRHKNEIQSMVRHCNVAWQLGFISLSTMPMQAEVLPCLLILGLHCGFSIFRLQRRESVCPPAILIAPRLLWITLDHMIVKSQRKQQRMYGEAERLCLETPIQASFC